MESYITLLRGINVGGRKIIKMRELAEMFESLGFRGVKTYVQSGNIIFQFKKESTKKLEELVYNQIFTKFGFDVSVQIMTMDRLKDIIKKNPFKNDKLKDNSFLHVTFLDCPPENYDLASIQNKTTENEDFKISDQCVYLFCPNGYGKTKLNNTFLEKQLGVKATTRNWKTILKLQDISQKM